jgi:hypothetical protein
LTECSVKLKCGCKRPQPAVGQKDPVELYYSMVLGLSMCCVG